MDTKRLAIKAGLVITTAEFLDTFSTQEKMAEGIANEILKSIDEAIEGCANVCEQQFDGCDKENVACHMLDAERIRAMKGGRF